LVIIPLKTEKQGVHARKLKLMKLQVGQDTNVSERRRKLKAHLRKL